MVVIQGNEGGQKKDEKVNLKYVLSESSKST